MDWFLYENGPRHERVKGLSIVRYCIRPKSGPLDDHERCSVKKGVLENVAKSIGKHLRQNLLLTQLQVSGMHL